MFNKRSRFTLIELIVVIAVLGILSAIVIPNISNINEKAKVAAVKSNIRNIQTAVDMFHLDYGYYPTDKQPEFIEGRDSQKNERSLLVGKEPINFEKDDFIPKYLREAPADRESYYIDSLGTVIVDGNSDYPRKLKEIVSGSNHTFALTNKGELYSWGENNQGQLGLNHKKEVLTPTKVDFFDGKKVENIYTNKDFSFAILEDGSVYSWGNNGYGQLGLGHKIRQSLPQKVDFFDSIKIKKLELGLTHCLALSKEGTLYSWGYNYNGQLGLGNKTNNSTPQEISFFNDKKILDISSAGLFSLVLLENGEVYSWGENSWGSVGLGHNDDVLSPQKISSLDKRNISKIWTTTSTSFAFSETLGLYAWGYNQNGNFGNGTMSSVNSPTRISFFSDKALKDLELGNGHQFAILNTGEIYGWGHNSYGQLGLGHNSHVSTPVKIEHSFQSPISNVFADTSHTFIQLENGDIYGHGTNSCGELGLGDKENKLIPHEIVELNKIIKEQ